MDSIVLVTGATAGIGRCIARTLARSGFRVFGTGRNPGQERGDGIEMVRLDVTSDESVARCVQTVLERAGTIDVLVNNAGVELTGAAEETSIEEAKRVFETNFFGMVRTTVATLPTMRAARRGRIVFVSSAAGQASVPFQSIYSASKHATEGYAKSLVYEVAPFGIEISAVQPGIFRSEIADRMPLAERRIADYEAARSTVARSFCSQIATAPEPDAVASLVLSIARGAKKGLRFPVGVEGEFAATRCFVPESIEQACTRWAFGLGASGGLSSLLAHYYRLRGRRGPE